LSVRGVILRPVDKSSNPAWKFKNHGMLKKIKMSLISAAKIKKEKV